MTKTNSFTVHYEVRSVFTGMLAPKLISIQQMSSRPKTRHERINVHVHGR